MAGLARLAPWLGLTVVGLFLHARQLAGGRPYFRDSHLLMVPAKRFLWETFRAGEIPQWYPYDAGGTPFIAQPANSFFHPTTLYYALLPFWTAFTLQDVTGTLLALFGAYLVARELSQSRQSAFLAAVTFGGCGYLVCITEFQCTKLAAGGLAWYVWSLLVAERRRGRWHLAPAFAMALIILAGEPQTALLAAGVGLALLVGARRKVAGAFFAPLLGGLLAACQLLPALRMIPETERAHVLTFADAWPLTGASLLGMLVPLRFDPRGDFVASTYLGIAAVGCALATLARVRTNRAIATLWLLVIAAVWLGLGDAWGLHRLVRAIVPFWDMFRYPIKLTLVVAFAAALLAGYGFAMLSPALRQRWGWLLVALMTVELVWRTEPLIRTVDDSFYAEPVLAKTMRERGVGLYGSAFERLDRSRFGAEEEPFANAAAVGGFHLAFGAYFGLPMLTYYTPGRAWRTQSFFGEESRTVQELARVYGTLGAKYLVQSAQVAASTSPHIVAREPRYGYVLVYLRQALPRAYAAHRALAVADAAAAHELLFSTRFEPGREIAIETDEPRPEWSARADELPVTARIVARSNTSVTIDATLPWPGFVVLNETMYGGWQATVDGAPAPVLVANGFVRAVEAPPGEHTIEFRYSTPGLKEGVLLSTLALAASLLWLVARSSRSARSSARFG
jgi:hypothetical protein